MNRLFLVPCAALLAAGAASAQTYTAVDLTPDAVYATANAISTEGAAGSVAGNLYGVGRATFWDGHGQVDLHPAFVDGATAGVSTVQGLGGNLRVGWAASGPGSVNRPVPLVWQGAAASVSTLPIPFANAGGRALATDGSQIVGFGIPLAKDGTTTGAGHVLLWDVANGTVTDFGDGGGGAFAAGVGGGQQVGHVMKGAANAALWRGSARSLVILHPKNAVVSQASGTDGVRQVGHAGYDVRIRREAVNGNKDQRFNYAFVWSGTAASGLNIHPYPANALAGVNLTQSYALAVNGPWIAGYAGDQAKFATPAYNHAIVWDVNYQATDLNAFLPSGFVGAQATSVDAAGNVAGFMSKADGTRHAVVWLLNAAQ
jgi:hypothetical protein